MVGPFYIGMWVIFTSVLTSLSPVSLNQKVLSVTVNWTYWFEVIILTVIKKTGALITETGQARFRGTIVPALPGVL